MAGPTPLGAQQIVDVSGNHLTLNGNTWLPRGVAIRGFEAPPATLERILPSSYAGRQYYGPAELAAAYGFGADTLRFLVSQPGLDAQSPDVYDPQYVLDVEGAVTRARAAGFVVEIAMQDEKPSGDPSPHPLPIAATQRDWDLLNAAFGTDRGVLFELYNEPQPVESAANWALWANGDPAATGPDATIGMQSMITHLRAEQCQNVIVLDGLHLAKTLDGLPAIADPLGRIAYAVHPYINGSTDESQWDPEFGIPSQTIPVFADEWSAQAGTPLGLGQLTTYQPAVDLVNYLRVHGIGLAGGAFDVTGFIPQNVPGWTPTNYDNFASLPPLDDAGLLIHNDFEADYARPLTDADAVTN